jgi:non-ribosomal peptide synthase protein (TIGR01720 family)
MRWVYSKNLHQQATVERVAQDFTEALRALIAHCRSPEAGGVSAMDFPEAGLSQTELEQLLSRLGKGG